MGNKKSNQKLERRYPGAEPKSDSRVFDFTHSGTASVNLKNKYPQTKEVRIRHYPR